MSKPRQVLLLSSSKLSGFEYLEWAKDEINTLLKKNLVKKVTFIPYALKDHDKYFNQVSSVFKKWGYEMDGVHESKSPKSKVDSAEALFIGGGNTFQLLKSLYDNELIETIRNKVLKGGVPYIGASAGSNVATINICTTNDMPIVYPPSFDALKLVPFNLNPHYIDTDLSSTHMGESREDRINQYLEIPGRPAVVGLREGGMIHIEGDKATLKGLYGARVFTAHHEPVEHQIGADLSHLLNQ